MKITDLLTLNKIAIKAKAETREDAIKLLVDLHQNDGALVNSDVFQQAILEREAKGTTAIGVGLAVPHAKSEAVKKPSLAAITLTQGVDYQAPDGQGADLLFMIATPPGGDTHLEILSRMMVLLMDPDFCQKLRQAGSPEEFIALVDQAELAKYGLKDPALEKSQTSTSTPQLAKVLAVTACPTGIAHTYMAAEALEKAGAKMKVLLKVETNGSTGIQNPLTNEDIKSAEAIIIAADKNVETKRFEGKKVLFKKVADGIHKPEELIKEALSGTLPVFHHQGGNESDGATEEGRESLARGIYKSLMNGVSHMLPFVIGGGILIALAFLFDDYTINPASFGSNTGLARVLMTIGGAAFSLMLPILAGYIAMSIGDRPALAPGVVGGILARGGEFIQ
jgi:PTS system fructose-specific IIC component